MTRRAWAVVVVGALAVVAATAWRIARVEPEPRRAFVLLCAKSTTLYTAPDGDEIPGWQAYFDVWPADASDWPVSVRPRCRETRKGVDLLPPRDRLRPWLERLRLVKPRPNRVITYLADQAMVPLRDSDARGYRGLTIVRHVTRPSGDWLECVRSLTDLPPGALVDPAIAGRWYYAPSGREPGLVLTLAPDGALHVDSPLDAVRGVRWGATESKLFLEFADVRETLSYSMGPGIHVHRLGPSRDSFLAPGGSAGWDLR
ncbi:MAG: hypothetical protein K8T90_04170 [Planctomycetes bacterium]|nr:hypothetical protein [Planctomycetota bacterium]